MPQPITTVLPFGGAGKFDDKSNALVWEADKNILRSLKKINAIELKLLQGIENQTNTLYENTLNFSNGFHANNALLWGAKGGGKSSLIKSIFVDINKSNNNLKIIEINREDLETLPILLNHIRVYDKQFIIYCDDLSFDKNDTKFKIFLYSCGHLYFIPVLKRSGSGIPLGGGNVLVVPIFPYITFLFKTFLTIFSL